MKIDFTKINTVLLDMDGTLLDLHFDNHFWLSHLPKVYSQQNNITKDQALEVLNPIFKKHSATLNWYCVDFWSDQLGLDIMQHKAEVEEKIAYRPKAQDFLEHCKNQVDDVRLITNGHREVLKLKIGHTNIDQYFTEMVCSHELGSPKEDIQFWNSLQKHNAFDPMTTLFIDDSESVLDAAYGYGIKNVYSIAKPDSTKQRETVSKYPMIEDFITY